MNARMRWVKHQFCIPSTQDAGTSDIGQDHNNIGALTLKALDQYLSKRKFQACCKGIISNTIQSNCYRDRDICKISRSNAAQGKELKLDSNEPVVSECAYLPIVRGVEVISYRWVFCCQCVNLYRKEEEGLWFGQSKIFLTHRCLGFFLFPLSFFTPISVLLFSHCVFLQKKVIWTLICWQCSACLAFPPDLTVQSTGQFTISF